MRDFVCRGVFKDVKKQRQTAAKKDKTMKTTTLLAIAVASAFGLAASVHAGDVVMSPKAQALADSLKKVPGTSVNEPNLATNRPVGNAKAWALAQSLKKVPSTGPSIDLAHAPRPTMSPKDPRYETALRENATKQLDVQIAPLK